MNLILFVRFHPRLTNVADMSGTRKIALARRKEIIHDTARVLLPELVQIIVAYAVSVLEMEPVVSDTSCYYNTILRTSEESYDITSKKDMYKMLLPIFFFRSKGLSEVGWKRINRVSG